MSKRLFAVLMAGALVASVFTALPAQAAPEVPAVANIEDPVGDANTTSGDQVTPADVSSAGDFLKVWFTHDASKVSVHIQTEGPTPPTAYGIQYSVHASPNADGKNCLTFKGLAASGALQGSSRAKVFDNCNDGSNFFNNGADGEFATEKLGDGTGVTSLTFDRAYTPLLADGAVIAAPTARSDLMVGSTDAAFTGFRLDDTKPGTDYTLGGGAPVAEEPPAEAPPVEDKCANKKGKAKKKCEKKQGGSGDAGAACAAYVPGESGKDAPTTVVTPAATADAPIEVKVESGAGHPAKSTHTFYNVQVDSNGDTGLYVRYEFPIIEDHDLYVRNAEGEEVASAAGFNPTPFGTTAPVVGHVGFDGTGSGGHSEQGAEVIDGLKTADCGGYTLDLAGYLTEGGEFTLKLWLGEVQYDPNAEGKAYVF